MLVETSISVGCDERGSHDIDRDVVADAYWVSPDPSAGHGLGHWCIENVRFKASDIDVLDELVTREVIERLRESANDLAALMCDGM